MLSFFTFCEAILQSDRPLEQRIDTTAPRRAEEAIRMLDSLSEGRVFYGRAAAIAGAVLVLATLLRLI